MNIRLRLPNGEAIVVTVDINEKVNIYMIMYWVLIEILDLKEMQVEIFI